MVGDGPANTQHRAARFLRGSLDAPMTKPKPKNERRITPDRRQSTRYGRRAMEENDEERQLRITKLINDLMQQQSKQLAHDAAPTGATEEGVTRPSPPGGTTGAMTGDGSHQPQRPPGELLFEFYHELNHSRWRCELRDQGKRGIEAQFLQDDQVVIANTFHPRIDPTRTPREMAIAWAEQIRLVIEGYKHDAR